MAEIHVDQTGCCESYRLIQITHVDLDHRGYTSQLLVNRTDRIMSRSRMKTKITYTACCRYIQCQAIMDQIVRRSG